MKGMYKMETQEERLTLFDIKNWLESLPDDYKFPNPKFGTQCVVYQFMTYELEYEFVMCGYYNVYLNDTYYIKCSSDIALFQCMLDHRVNELGIFDVFEDNECLLSKFVPLEIVNKILAMSEDEFNNSLYIFNIERR